MWLRYGCDTQQSAGRRNHIATTSNGQGAKCLLDQLFGLQISEFSDSRLRHTVFVLAERAVTEYFSHSYQQLAPPVPNKPLPN